MARCIMEDRRMQIRRWFGPRSGRVPQVYQSRREDMLNLLQRLACGFNDEKIFDEWKKCALTGIRNKRTIITDRRRECMYVPSR
jgi:hypothetical protein